MSSCVLFTHLFEPKPLSFVEYDRYWCQFLTKFKPLYNINDVTSSSGLISDLVHLLPVLSAIIYVTLGMDM